MRSLSLYRKERPPNPRAPKVVVGKGGLWERGIFKAVHLLQGRIKNPPPLAPHLGQKTCFSGGGEGCVFFEPPSGRNFIRPPPLFYTPPSPRRVFSGVREWGCLKIGPPPKILKILEILESVQNEDKQGKYHQFLEIREMSRDSRYPCGNLTQRTLPY